MPRQGRELRKEVAKAFMKKLRRKTAMRRKEMRELGGRGG